MRVHGNIKGKCVIGQLIRKLIRGCARQGGYVPTVYNDWFLPSKSELNAMHVNLHQAGLGNFMNVFYWSSSASDIYNAWIQTFDDGSAIAVDKSNVQRSRAIRKFESSKAYATGDTGPAGGIIFLKVDTGGVVFTYYEAYPTDNATSLWSNVQLVAATGTAIGAGTANTAAILAQTGHTASAALLCDNLSVTK